MKSDPLDRALLDKTNKKKTKTESVALGRINLLFVANNSGNFHKILSRFGFSLTLRFRINLGKCYKVVGISDPLQTSFPSGIIPILSVCGVIMKAVALMKSGDAAPTLYYRTQQRGALRGIAALMWS